MTRIATLSFIFLAAWSLSSLPALAQGSTLNNGAQQTSNSTLGQPSARGGFLDNPLQAETLTELLASLLNILVQIGVVILTMMLVYCGFLFVTAQGNPEALTKAKSALIWTVVGGFLVLGAEVIAQAVESTVKAL